MIRVNTWTELFSNPWELGAYVASAGVLIALFYLVYKLFQEF